MLVISQLILGCECWKRNCDTLLSIIKEYVVSIWGMKMSELYGKDDASTGRFSPESLAGDPTTGLLVLG